MNILYLDMGWGMKYPFSPRTWSFDEWETWMDKLLDNGVDTLMVWPGLEFVKHGDEEEMERTKRWLERFLNLCEIMKMKVWLGRSINAYCDYSFKELEDRDVNDCLYVNILSDRYEEYVIHPLRLMLSDCPEFSGWWCIDSHPGKALNSTPEDFAEAFARQLHCIPCDPTPIYWMWAGWTNQMGQRPGWKKTRQAFWAKAQKAFKKEFNDNYISLCSWPGHLKSLHSTEQWIYEFPYHLGEPEPSLPWSYREDEPVYSEALLEKYPVIYNMQTPCLRTSYVLQLMKQKKASTTVWQDIVDYWCWNDESLEDLEAVWSSMHEKIESKSLSHEDVEFWKKMTGCDFENKLGLLSDFEKGE